MRSDKSFILYILILILTPLFLYYILVGDIPYGYHYDSPGICLVSVLSGFLLVYLLYKVQDKFFSKNIDFDDIGQDHSKKRSSAGYQSKKKKKGGILNIFSEKSKCEHCGTEMEYKEAMDCYYCPECHEYK